MSNIAQFSRSRLTNKTSTEPQPQIMNLITKRKETVKIYFYLRDISTYQKLLIISLKKLIEIILRNMKYKQINCKLYSGEHFNFRLKMN